MSDFYELSSEFGTDKVLHHGYHFYYPKHLERLRDKEFNMLEIGYQGGHSCRMWERYFPKANVFAMDIGVEGQFDNHTVIRGDQGNASDLMNVVDKIGTAKFILDDGSHHPVHQIETFNILFSNLLEPGGVYIIEDIECNYWNSESNIYGYRIGFFNAVDYTKKLIDYVNSEFSGKENKLRISSITYGQNCVIIEKQTEEEMMYFNRPYRFGMYL
jgi:8-demethyl-8-alpha-L-rhamnosyltetracenomycin-C 2'-O-methyltransferase